MKYRSSSVLDLNWWTSRVTIPLLRIKSPDIILLNVSGPLVPEQGIEPLSTAYRAIALPLSYTGMVGSMGIEPMASRVWGGRSTAELTARWCWREELNLHERELTRS